MLAIGIVVDDAIVVVEAAQVNIDKGMNAKKATFDAISKVTAPVIATTLVLVTVFIPVAGMGGITGRLYQQFAITIVVSVIVSSVNALTLSPALASLLLKKPVRYGGLLGKFFNRFNQWMNKSTDSYSLVFVFLILAAQYESWSLPISSLMGTPFAIFGALFALWLGRLFPSSSACFPW